MSRLPRASRLMIASCSVALLASCSSWGPSPMPAGYTYHYQAYKSPPAPRADDIGYEFTVAANEKAVEAWREVARDLVSKVEGGYAFPGRDIALIAPLEIDEVNNSLHYALHDAFAAKGYRLRPYSPEYPGLSVTINPLAGDQKEGHEKARLAYAESRGFPLDDVSGVVILLELREGANLAHQTRGIYTIPTFAYDPEFNRQLEYRDMRSVGHGPFWTSDPALKPALVRPAAPRRGDALSRPSAFPEAPAEKESAVISKDDLAAPPARDEANKPLDLQPGKD